MEGICAMIRSIDPFAHIEGKLDYIIIANSQVVVNLVRFINEFWFINLKGEDIDSMVKIDNANSELKNRIKIYSDIEVYL